MQLEFSVRQQHIERRDTQKVVADSRNYLTAHFTFSDEWAHRKTAVFRNGEKVFSVLLEEDACLVPWEVLTEGSFTVSVFSGELITSDKASVAVYASGYEEGETPIPPAENVYQQILVELERQSKSEYDTVSDKVSSYLLPKNRFTLFTAPLAELQIAVEETIGYAEYNFSFSVEAASFQLSLPQGYLWDGGTEPSFEVGKCYEVSLCNVDHIALASKGVVYE